MGRILLSALFAAVLSSAVGAGAPAARPQRQGAVGAVRTLDGRGNNLRRPEWGRAGSPYLRVASPSYSNGVARPVGGPSPRYLSNRIFNDTGQNLFSENGVTQWGFVWGQFMDHTFGLRQETGGESAPLAFDPGDPLESFRNDLGAIDFTRTPAAPGTGASSAREQINTVSSYIDAWNVYGGTRSRLEWLRSGPLDGRLANNGARLLLPDGYLPRRSARGDVSAAPEMTLVGRLAANPGGAMVAGDVRANENVALEATHTLFAREHNRIVARLPRALPEETKFQIARRIVGAEEQYITYREFLPALGVRLAPYRGYNPEVNAGLSNEFAVVGYRAHSMIHGELEPSATAGTYSEAQLDAFRAQGIEVESEDGDVVLVIPLNLAFGNPDLLRSVGIGPVLAGLGNEREYRNDEQIDNQLRSVLFQVPKPGVDPAACLDGQDLPDCFTGVLDLAAIDIARGRDHGVPSYNDLRRAYGLRPRSSFTEITGEATSRFPLDREIDRADPIDDPDILDFVKLLDAEGKEIPLGSEEADSEAVIGVRRTTLAARLRAVYADVDDVDAFVGMVSEPHRRGSEFGELQLAIWKRQFEALRDGDRFFYLNDPELRRIERRYGITYRHTLAQIITMNTGIEVGPNVFEVDDEAESAAEEEPRSERAAPSCSPAQRSRRHGHRARPSFSGRSQVRMLL